MRYFNTFPVVDYNNVLVRNIVTRVKAFEQTKTVKTLFYPYRIKDGERPDTVAHNYYGNSNYFWVIFIVNDIVDPYYEWPMSQQVFDRYIIEKYGNLSTAQRTILKYRKIGQGYYLHNTSPSGIITETMYNSLTESEKSNYTRQKQGDEVFITIDTYDLLTNEERIKYTPVYAYDYEFEANESRREIRLLNLDYLNRIEEDLKRLMR